MPLKPISNNIVFRFLDKTGSKDGKKQFIETTQSGLIIQSYDESTKENRWGIIEALGPDVKSELKVGDVILVEALKWTNSFKVDDAPVWITTEDCVLLVREEE